MSRFQRLLKGLRKLDAILIGLLRRWLKFQRWLRLKKLLRR